MWLKENHMKFYEHNITIYISGNKASGDDSSDEEKLEIVEDDQNSEFDKKLEDKSSKFSLSVMNVKSIIHVRTHF